MTRTHSYYRKFDPAKTADATKGADGKRGCLGFRFVPKDKSNLRPFVSFLEPVFICPDIKDRDAQDILLQVVHSSQTGKIRVDAGYNSPSVHTCEYMLESPLHKQGQVRLGDVVRIKTSEGGYLCADFSKESSFDAKTTFNFSMYSP